MMRLGVALKVLLVLALALRLHHHFRGPPFDYAGLAAAAAASWVGVPGPGEPVLIAAGLLAAKHKLDIGSVIAVAWAAATAGGIAGWLIGMKAGRVVVITRGPLHHMRMRVLARGDEVFERYAVLAIQLTPSWVAGIHHVRPAVYLPWNAIGAVFWAVGIGLGAFFLGPPIEDLVSDIGWVTAGAVIVLVALVVGAELLRRRRRARDRAVKY